MNKSMGIVGSAVAPMFGTLFNAQSRGVSSMRARGTVSTETTLTALGRVRGGRTTPTDAWSGVFPRPFGTMPPYEPGAPARHGHRRG